MGAMAIGALLGAGSHSFVPQWLPLPPLRTTARPWQRLPTLRPAGRQASRVARAAAKASPATALKAQLRKKGTSDEDARAIVEELKSLGALSKPKDIETVINACEKGGKTELAEELRGQDGAAAEPAEPAQALEATPENAGRVAPPFDPTFTKYSRGALMQRMRRRNCDPAELANVVDTLAREGHLEETHSYTVLLRMCESGLQWQWALKILEMGRDGPGLVAETCATAMAACAKAQQWQQALGVLEGMTQGEWGTEPDRTCYHSVLSACSRSSEWEAALAVFQKAKGDGVADAEAYSIAMMAMASSESAWPGALQLLSELPDEASVTERDDHERALCRDTLAYGIAVFGAERGGGWQACLQLLDDMKSEKVQADAVTLACVAKACQTAGAAEQANGALGEMQQRNLGRNPQSILEEASWVTDGPEMQQPVPFTALATMARKEVEVYKYVARRATPGDIDSVLAAIESYAQEKLWLKIQGQQKRELLEKSLRNGDRIVECGCYVGYSSLVMARRLRQLGGQGSVTTIDVDAATAYVARAMISFAGAQDMVQVRVGCAGDWIATGQLGTIDFLLLDHRGTIYHDDLHAAQPSLSPHARVFADNVFYPGAPLFLNYIDVMGYDIEIHELKEFLREDLDDWVVICRPTKPRGEMPEDVPPELQRLSAEVDAISWRSQKGAVDWNAFQDRIRPVFYEWKESKGL